MTHPELIHFYTIEWTDPEKGEMSTMTTDPDEAESQARAGAYVTVDTRTVT